jgi:hypothetical protein
MNFIAFRSTSNLKMANRLSMFKYSKCKLLQSSKIGIPTTGYRENQDILSGFSNNIALKFNVLITVVITCNLTAYKHSGYCKFSTQWLNLVR